MFGFVKRKEVQKYELLQMENICLDCSPKEKEEVIREAGNLLWNSGYVYKGYIEAMLKRELSYATNIGNGIALPHGVEEARKEIRRSGMAVMVFPQGTDWGGEKVKLVIGIAGAGEEHLEMLSFIAGRFSSPDDVEEITSCTREQIYHIFTGKED